MDVQQTNDPHGKLFHVNEYSDRVFRLIHPDFRKFYLRLLEDHLSSLIEAGLIQTCRSQKDGPNGELVLEHKRILINFPFEWSRLATHKAALFFLDLNKTLIKKRLFSNDAHSLNIVFDKNKPVFIDWGSLIRNPGYISPFWVSEFYSHFVFPLASFAVGGGGLYRSLLRKNLAPRLTVGQFKRIVLESLKADARRGHITSMLRSCWIYLHTIQVFNSEMRKSKKGKIDGVNQFEFLEGHRELINDFGRRFDRYREGADDSNSITAMARAIREIGMKTRPRTVVEIGNLGIYSSILGVGEPPPRTIVIDTDEAYIDRLFIEENVDAFLVSFEECEENIHGGGYAPFDSRYSADLVFAQDLHLYGKNQSTIVQKLKGIVKNYLAIYFAWHNHCAYDRANLLKEIEQFFSLDAVYDLDFGTGNIMLFRRIES